MTDTPTYSVGIQTYVYRFDSYFKPLLARVHRQRPNLEKVIFVNGQHKEPFHEQYRRDMMQYASNFQNTFLVMSPIVRGCSFMWNTSINYTSNHYTLILGDDVCLLDGFFDEFENMLKQNHELGDESFRINWHWSHFCIHRNDVINKNRVGFFDERLIGFGEEDGDWMWRFRNKIGHHMRNYTTDKLPFCSDDACLPGKNTKTHSGTKYSAFNRDFQMNKKLEPDLSPNGVDDGCYGGCGCYNPRQKLREGMETPNMYPGETFYRENIDKL